jgi:hypothetical protein
MRDSLMYITGIVIVTLITLVVAYVMFLLDVSACNR